MKIGTKSLLFGEHQVVLHPIFVFLAWRNLYGLPSFKEFICIIIHDWGYWGKANIDGKEGQLHPELGGQIASWLFGKEYGDLCRLHSRSYAKIVGKEVSKLCWPDKFAITYNPVWLCVFLGRLSGELSEYRLIAKSFGFPIEKTDEEWYWWVWAKATKISSEIKDKEREIL